MIPEIVAGKPYGSIDRKTIPEHARADAYNLKTIWDTEGVVKYSMVFYGYYGNEEFIGAGYRLPLAYFLTGLGSFAFSFLMVLRQMASNARMSRLSSKDEQFTFAWKLYTSWDFMIGQTETANQKFASIATTFRESILEEKEKTKDENKKLIIFLRVLANLLVLISLGLSTWAIQICVDRSRQNDLKKRKEKYVPTFWEENEVTVIMTAITTLFPSWFDLIALMEKYHPRVNLRWQLGRIFVLNLLNIYTLFIALFWKQQDLTKEIELQLSNATTTEWRNVTRPCPLDLPRTTAASMVSSMTVNISGFVTDSVFGSSNDSTLMTNCTSLELHNITQKVDSDLCWETIIGQEVLKLTIMDLLFTAGNVLIVDFLRGLCIRYTNICCCWDLEKQFPEYGEFKTAENILHLINNQGMIWLGTFFCPALPMMNLSKLLLLLYMRNWAVMVCNVPQDRIFRASRSNNFYFAMLLVMLFLCTLPVAFAMVLMTPSPNCGPFSGMDFMMDVITNTMENEFSETVNTVLDYIASPAVIIPMFLLLSLGIYYLIALSRALREANNDLKMQLEYERTDGRKKVYAMAAVKDEDGGQNGGSGGIKNYGDKSDGGGKGGRSGKRMVGAVASVLAATRMSRMLSGAPPVAVVKGKPSYPRRVPPSVPPRPRRPLPGNPQVPRQSLQNVTSRLLQNREGSAAESRGRRNLRNLATMARTIPNSADQREHAPPRVENRRPGRTENQPGTSEGRGQTSRQTGNRRPKQQQQQQQQQQREQRQQHRNQQQRQRQRNTNNRPSYGASGSQFAGAFLEEDEAVQEDEFSRYASEDAQQSQRLLRAGQSVDSGIHIDTAADDTGYRQSTQTRPGQRRRQYLSVEGEDEEDEDESDESETESEEDEDQIENEPISSITYVDETEGEDNNNAHRTQNDNNDSINMSDPSLHTNAVYEEDVDSDDFDEEPEGVLSASGHLIPKIRVTDFSDDRSSNSDVGPDEVFDRIAPEGGSDEPVITGTGDTETNTNDAQDTSAQPPPVKAKPTNWRSRQRTVDQSADDSGDIGLPREPPTRPSSKPSLFAAMNVLKKAARAQSRQHDQHKV